jgi:hypothetical protein
VKVLRIRNGYASWPLGSQRSMKFLITVEVRDVRGGPSTLALFVSFRTSLEQHAN